jgi:hypothetical protein
MAIPINRVTLAILTSIAGLLNCFVLKAQAVKHTDLTHLSFTVSQAPEWSNLFKRYDGWFGGDGIYTIPLNGREQFTAGNNHQTLFIFSDSMIGQVTDSTMVPGYKMIHNSVAYLTGNEPLNAKMKFYWNQDKNSNPEPIFTPKTLKTAAGDYYWLGDGFVNTEINNAIYIFGYRVRNVSNEAFGFREVGNTIIKIPAHERPPFSSYKQMDTPFYLTNGNEIGSFGAGIYVNTKPSGAKAPDGYVYIYGVTGRAKQLLVARVKPADFEQFTKWRFWNGSQWGVDINKATAITDGVSNELSLTSLPDGRYAVIFQEGGMGKYVAMRIGASPAGPFGPVIRLWDCSNDLQEKTHVVYNAKAHPGLSAPGELLISYNINSVEFIKDLNKDPHLYRPRFIRLKFK